MALALRVGHAGEQRLVALLGVDVHEVDVELVAERRDDLLGLVQAQHAVVDEDAGELVADRAVQQRGDDARVDAAGQAADDAGVADLRADRLDRVVDDVDHRPQRRDLRDVVQERADDLLAVLGVRDLRVELRRVQAALRVLHRGDRGGAGARGDDEAFGRGAHGVAVAHPDLADVSGRPSSSSQPGAVTVSSAKPYSPMSVLGISPPRCSAISWMP